MTTGRGDEPVDHDGAEWEDDRPRSLLNATWFRVLVVVLVIGAVAAVAVPYVMNLTSAPRPVARVPAAPPKQESPAVRAPAAPAPPATPAAAAAPAAPAAPPPAATPTPAAPANPQTAKPTEPTAKTETAQPAAKRPAAGQPQGAKTAPAGAASGLVWVQVGAFRDQAAAQRLAASLKEKGFTVVESTTAPAAASRVPAAAGKADQYDVVVSGGATDVMPKLTAKGLSAERTGDGAIVRPSLPLRDAVALSNDLRADGFKVTVRRVSGGTAAAPAAKGETLHRVRVGAFPDRTAARDAVQKLEALGYKPFIARGP